MPGVGLGGLSLGEVIPVIKDLPDSVHVWMNDYKGDVGNEALLECGCRVLVLGDVGIDYFCSICGDIKNIIHTKQIPVWWL